MKVLRAAAILALLAGPAYAQDDHVQRYGEEDKDKTYGQIQADKAAAQAYRHSLGNIPDQAAPNDPWGNARGANTTQTAAKPNKGAKPTKTGSNAN